MKRIVSFVPSWTETLIEAGANVVGRTRFCIHPASAHALPSVGGTKDFDDTKLAALSPDLIIMDREENTLDMFERASRLAPVHASHVTSVREMPRELRALAAAIAQNSPRTRDSQLDSNRSSTNESNLLKANETSIALNGDARVAQHLEDFAKRFESALARSAGVKARMKHNDSIPAIIKIVKGNPSVNDKFTYVIWQNPWMCIGPNTFIASMLEQVGFDLANLEPQTEQPETENLKPKPQTETGSGSANRKPSAADNYPKLNELPSKATILLSSEPFPFATKTPTLPNANVALVDGERYSWFGLRALRFLETLTES